MKHRVIATAVLALFIGPAHAAGARLRNLTGVTDTIDVVGMVDLYGTVGVASRAGAAIDNRQAVVLDHVSLAPPGQSETRGTVTIALDSVGTLSAMLGANAAGDVAGNLGVNLAQGIDNAQSNDAALASVDVGNVFGSARVVNRQSSSGDARIDNVVLNASIGDGSLARISGSVGVNVAAGVGNVQSNTLAGSISTPAPTTDGAPAAGAAMIATDDNTQTAAARIEGRFAGTTQLGANTLTGATGNLGVNLAGGAGNLQHNGLAVASLGSTH